VRPPSASSPQAAIPPPRSARGNAAFRAAWERAYGASAVPDFLSVDGWDGMAAAFELIREMKGAFTADRAIAFLKDWRNPDSSCGAIAIDPATCDIVRSLDIRRVELPTARPPTSNWRLETIPRVKDPCKELHRQ